MRPYVLVSLWSEADEATRCSHAFALKLRERRAPLAFISGTHPDPEELRQAVAMSPQASIVLFAHGGSALSACRAGAPWIAAEELAQHVSGRRVYAFACSTFAPNPALFYSTFACQAVSACIEVFVGHAAPVMTPFADQGDASQKMEDALLRLIESFIDGEDDQDELVSIGRGNAPWDVAFDLPLDLPSQSPGVEGALGWSSAAFLQGFFQSLRVRTKADDASLAATGP